MRRDDARFFDIGAVSRLTGLSTPNLRMWEKRHQVVEPSRGDSNRRRYTEEDIRRLTLVKTLADHGHSIGSLAAMATEELEERLRTLAVLVGEGGKGGGCRAAVVGGELIGLLTGREASLEGIDVLERFETMAEAERGLVDPVDLLLVATPTLFSETLGTIRQLVEKAGALRAVVAYRFAPSDATRAIDKDIEGITAIRFPIDFAELRVICRAEAALIREAGSRGSSEAARPEAAGSEAAGPGGNEGDEAVPARRFDDRQLARLARASGAIECECPRHLAELLGALNAFADYSEDCEHRNLEDARMHAYLHRMTCRARGVIEEALAELIRFEGIEFE